jgi:hypothetical protein
VEISRYELFQRSSHYPKTGELSGVLPLEGPSGSLTATRWSPGFRSRWTGLLLALGGGCLLCFGGWRRRRPDPNLNDGRYRGMGIDLGHSGGSSEV